jgi:diguanylate cyclase (GGDEF)-like protein
VTLLFGDLDRFKEINDRFGHTVGDAVLRHVAARLKGEVRASDTVTRLGGDEFVVVCEDLGAADAAEMAHRLAAAVRAPVEVEGRLVEVSISVGIVAAESPDVTPRDLLARADAEMYRRKHAGAPEDTGE